MTSLSMTMKKFILLGFVFVCASGAVFCRNYSDIGQSSPFGQYGADFSGTMGAGTGLITETRHHGFGHETGIGSSTMQTTSATAESMPSRAYRPTSISPAIPFTSNLPALTEPYSFSHRMASPAFKLSETKLPQPNFPGLARSSDLGARGEAPISSLGSQEMYGFFGHNASQGRVFDRTLLDPFKGN